MKAKNILISFGVTASLAILATGVAISAQEKYTLKVPGGLAFSEFKGYEGWQLISVSHNGPLLAAILGNPTMIEAYKAGIPGNGKPFPDGSKMAKVHWNPKTNNTQPGQPLQPATQHDVDFMVKDSKRFADSGGWGGRVRVRCGVCFVQTCRLDCQSAAGERRQVRICVPPDREERGLRFTEYAPR